MLSELLHPDLGRRWCDGSDDTQADLVAQAERIAARLDCAGGSVVLSCRHARSFVPGLLGAWLAGATVELLPNVQPGTLDRVDADPDVAYVLHDVAARQDRSAKAIYVPDLVVGVVGGAAQVTGAVAAWPTRAVRMTTSGSTERPRYVTKSMAQLTGELDVLATVFPAARCVLSTVPLSHLYGLLFGALLPLRLGARIVSHDALLPADLAARIEHAAVDLMISTPAHLRAMAEATMPRGLRVITSGARLPAELHLRLVAAHGWHVTDVLGSTETGGIATRHHPTEPWTAMPGVTVSAPDGQLVVASPWCGGAQVALDDRIELRSGGTFQYLGRSHELVKIAGKRAHAQAIEAAVLAIAGVTDAALVVHDAAGKEPRVALAVVVAAGAEVSREAIVAAIRREFDAVFVPRIIKHVPAIPRTERGKRSAEALRALLGLTTAPTTHLVDVRRVAPGAYLAYIPRDLAFFGGHFEELAILPGAVLIERVVWPAVRAEYPEVRALRAIRRLRFRRPVYPDQELAIALTRTDQRLAFEVSCAALPVASGQLIVE
jgi:4-coumarate--CoA ligase (photoactive yellow protein activation family)